MTGAVDRHAGMGSPATGSPGAGSSGTGSPGAGSPVTGGRAWARYLDAGLGLKEYWYPACFARELAEGATVAEEICGERILIKRVNGQPYAIADRCPHRGVAFSARPECLSEHTVSCWFHGFTFDVRDGNLVEVLSQPGSALIGRVAVGTYPTREACGLVWVFIGDGEPVPFEDDLPPVLQRHVRGEERRAFFPLARVRIACDWRLAIENGFDPGHVFGHRDSELVTGGYVRMPIAYYPESTDVFELDTTPGRASSMTCNHLRWTYVWDVSFDGATLETAYPGRRQELIDEVTGLDEAALARRRARKVELNLAMHLPCLLEVRSFPDGYQTHLEWFVPVDEGHHSYIIMASALVDSDEEEQEFLDIERTRWAPLVWSKDDSVVGFNNYDAFGRQQIAHAYEHEGWWHNERLYKPDAAVTEWRRFVSDQARALAGRDRFQRRSEPEPSVVRFVYD